MEFKYETETIQIQRLEHIENATPCFLDKRTNRIYIVDVPDSKLSEVASVRIQTTQDLYGIPKKISGTYWIRTNEPIAHCLNKGIRVPIILDGFQTVYSGSSSDLRERCKQHLLRTNGVYGTLSGISVDILCQSPTINKSSHAKCLWSSKKKKLPKIGKFGQYDKIDDKSDILDTMYLSSKEKSYISNNTDIFFKNGIHVGDDKHSSYEWIFYYTPITNHSVRDFVEIEWRKLHGIPILCSYMEGR